MWPMQFSIIEKHKPQRHIESKHEGICYNCTYCGYKALCKCNIKDHIKTQHEGICYSCDQCDYKAPYP